MLQYPACRDRIEHRKNFLRFPERDLFRPSAEPISIETIIDAHTVMNLESALSPQYVIGWFGLVGGCHFGRCAHTVADLPHCDDFVCVITIFFIILMNRSHLIIVCCVW